MSPTFKDLLVLCITTNNVICGKQTRVINNTTENVSAISDNKFKKDVKIKVIIDNIQEKLISHSIESNKYKFI